MVQETQGNVASKCPVSASVISIDRLEDLQTVLRSRAVVEDANVSTDNYISQSALGDINVKEFMEGILTMINGDEHRHRRRLLNSLVRPEELVRFREDVVLPSVDRWLTRAVKRDANGAFKCDLSEVIEWIFLEFAAKIIGLQDVESDERMDRLRSCVFPIFSGLSASHFDNREAVTKAGVEAKRIFVEEYYLPSFKSVKEALARVASGELPADAVPLNLLHMIATGADPRYLDEEVAIREAILFFVATTGTSTQAVLSTVHDLSRWLEKHPEDAPLVSELEFLSGALQESLRLKAPYVSYLTRLAVEDLEIGGCPIKAGDEIHALVPRAGKDKTVFGPDAHEFNPKRAVPEGVNRYGVAFGTGPHQCLGLRAVLGNDGHSGGHIRLLQRLFQIGIRIDQSEEPKLLAMRESEAADEIPTYISFPVIFTKWGLNE